MSAIGTLPPPTSSSASGVKTAETEQKEKAADGSLSVKQEGESTKASEQYANGQKGERKLESSVREAEVRASFAKPKQTPPPYSEQPPLKSEEKHVDISIDGQNRKSKDVDFSKPLDLKNDPAFKGLPVATQDKLQKEIDKTPEEGLKLQMVVQNENYNQLSNEQKTKMLNVFANCSPKARAELEPLLDRKVVIGSGNPPATAPALLTEDNTKAHKTLLDHLDTVAGQKLEPQLANRRGELLGKLVQETGRPAYSVHQGNVGTCAATTVQMHLLQHSPAEYARVISGLASPEKSVVLADGSKMEAAQNQANKFLKTGPDPRNVTERMFQGAVQQYGDQIPVEQGGHGKDYKYDANNPDNTGMWDHQTGRVMKSLYNRDYSYQPLGANGSRGIESVPTDAKGKDKMRADLFNELKNQMDSHQGPIAAHVKWDVDDKGRDALHEVLIEKMENGRVYFRNPWGSNRSQGAGYADGLTLSNPTRRVENNSQGIESMTEADFQKLVNGATIGPPVGGA